MGDNAARAEFYYAMKGLGESFAMDPFAMDAFERGDFTAFPISQRREVVNMRNSRLKLEREKQKLADMKSEIIRNLVGQSSDTD